MSIATTEPQRSQGMILLSIISLASRGRCGGSTGPAFSGVVPKAASSQFQPQGFEDCRSLRGHWVGWIWMAEEPECAGVFYADGYVRVYHGKLTDLPRRYIARERLCLRGTTDYWVNAMDGQPFFVVSCAVDPGLLSILREHIAPRLKADVPNQPTEEELQADPHLSR